MNVACGDGDDRFASEYTSALHRRRILPFISRPIAYLPIVIRSPGSCPGICPLQDQIIAIAAEVVGNESVTRAIESELD